MILVVARKEIREHLRDGRFRWAAASVLILLTAAVAWGWIDYRDWTREVDAAAKADREQWENQGKRNPHTAAHFGMYVFRPRLPGSLLDRGLDPYLGRAVWLEAHFQNPLKYRPAEDATSLQRMGELTAALVLQALVPLLIITLGYPAFAGERESGTLRQLMSLGVPRHRLVTGKMVGTGAALALMLVPAAALGTLALLFRTGPEAMPMSLPRMGMMFTGYLLYFAAILGITLSVSAWSRNSWNALLVLLVFWIVNCFVAPRAASDLAERLVRLPNGIQFWEIIQQDMHQAVDGHDPSNERTKALMKTVLAQYGVQRIEDLPISFDGLALQMGEEYGNGVFDHRYGDLNQAYRKQETVHQWAALFAPFLAVRSLSMSMAGTDRAHQWDFTTAAERYRRVLNKQMNDYLTYHSKTGDFFFFTDRELWSQVPPFHYEFPSTRWALASQVLPLALLSCWAVSGLGAALWAGSRQRVD